MTTHSDVAKRFAERGRPLRGHSVFADNEAIYSYGLHFPMAFVYDDEKLFLINGDSYSPTTNRHQSDVRSAIQFYSPDKYQSIIVPFSALDSAIASLKGENRSSSRWDYRTLRIIEKGVDSQKYFCEKCGLDFSNSEEAQTHKSLRGDGHYRYRHLLAPSVFSLTVDFENQKGYFLSGFDETARAWNGGYFLSRLPKKPSSLAHAFEILKPEPVKRAIAKGIKVRRQGDIFYIPDEKMTTRKLGRKGTRLPEMYQKPLIGWNDEILGYEPTDIPADYNESADIANGRRPRLLGTNHFATEAFNVGDDTYARGSLYHRPSFREADHMTIRMGKIWGRIFRNTALGSWSVSGRVD
jgi:hypothetical protein